MFNLPNERGLASIIWEPLDYSERFFTKSGNTYIAVPNLINLYDTLSAFYGNDTFTTTGAKPVVPAQKQSGYSIVNPAAWISGTAPLQVCCPAASRMELSLFAGNGKLVRTLPLNGDKGINRFGGWKDASALPPGLYIMSLKVNGVIWAQRAAVK
jgi:hypothetical protein